MDDEGMGHRCMDVYIDGFAIAKPQQDLRHNDDKDCCLKLGTISGLYRSLSGRGGTVSIPALQGHYNDFMT